MKLLNLGCGARAHPDWVNVDVRPDLPGVLVHDLKEPLPFPAATFDAVYHAHVLEHLRKTDAPVFLAECHRVLKPGGVLRVWMSSRAGPCASPTPSSWKPSPRPGRCADLDAIFCLTFVGRLLTREPCCGVAGCGPGPRRRLRREARVATS